MQNHRKNPWLLPGLLLAVVLLSLAVFGFVLWRKSPPPHEYLTNSLGMRFVRIPPGKFLMGAPANERDRGKDEEPQHEVEITRPFFMGVTEVTQGEYEKIMGTNPAVFGRNPDHAVENVSWDEAVEFCRRLSELPEEKAAGRVYRLPTEAEWEYACRAGTTTPYSFGEGAAINDYCWFYFNSRSEPDQAGLRKQSDVVPAVGQKKPNAFGLYDLHGNVREWCADWYDKDYYRNSPSRDPPGPGEGVFRVVRGGSRSDGPMACRSAARLGLAPDIRLGNGFRLVLDEDGGQK
ncbi:MAG: formylglycine-generating enzyme family protein [Planctomycetes bacterium]|nr:formylglycine-generating enzyme family protein [Planctomycetota bacterium]